MHQLTKSWLLALITATLAFGCTTSAPPESNADAELNALVTRARNYAADAEKTPNTLSPDRKAELQQLASDVRAWQAQATRDDIRVTGKRETMALRANDGGGAGSCDADCPVYQFADDSICFFEKSECSTEASDDDGLGTGTICVYSCISIASGVAPERSKRP